MKLLGWEITKADSSGSKNIPLETTASPWERNQGLVSHDDYTSLMKQYKSWVYVGVFKNAVAVARYPIHLYARKKNKNSKIISKHKMVDSSFIKFIDSQPHLRKYLINSEAVVEITEHPLLDILNTVNSQMNRFDLFSKTQMFLELTGNAYWYLVLNRIGLPDQIWPLTPANMKVNVDENSRSGEFISGYTFTNGVNKILFKREEIIHFTMPSPYSNIYGMGPIAAGQESIKFDHTSRNYENVLLDNQCRPDVILSTEQTVTEANATSLIGRIRNAFSGRRGLGKWLLLDKGLKAEPLNLPLREMGFLQGRKQSKEEIAGILGVPVSKLTTEDVNLCYDEKTEYLTNNGWKLYKNVSNTDKVASCIDGRFAFVKPLNRWENKYKGTMFHYKNHVTDLMVTPNHKIHYRTYYTPEYKVKEAQEITEARIVFKNTCSEWKGTDEGNIPFGIDKKVFLDFLGYFISEGGMSIKYRNGRHFMFTLCQKNKKDAMRIRGILHKLPFNYGEYYDETQNIYRWNVYGKRLYQYLLRNVGSYCYNKRVPAKIRNLNKELLSILFNALMLGDGSWDKREGRTSGYYSTVSKQLADDVMEIALKLGYRVSCDKRFDNRPCKDGSPRRDMYYIHFSEWKEVEIGKKKDITEVYYEGNVSCFEVPSHLLITRRNGFVSIQGNSNAFIGEIQYIKDTIAPRLTCLEEKLNERYTPMYDENLFLTYGDVIPQDKAYRLTEIQARLSTKYSSINEERKKDGLDPVEWGDKPVEQAPPAMGEGAPPKKEETLPKVTPKKHWLDQEAEQEELAHEVMTRVLLRLRV